MRSAHCAQVGEGEESVGHESGRKIVRRPSSGPLLLPPQSPAADPRTRTRTQIDILERNPKKDPEQYTEEDLAHMRKGASRSLPRRDESKQG